MIDGTITLTCDKCGAKFTKVFTSEGPDKYEAPVIEEEEPGVIGAEIPTRDGILHESGFATLYIDKEYILCPNCAAAWKAKQAELSTVFNTNAIDFLKTTKAK